MALSDHARRYLTHAMKSSFAGDEIADVVDAGSGTLSTPTKDRIKVLFANRTVGTDFAASVDAGTALTGREKEFLGTVLTNREVADEIADVLAT